jgi:hypothetical protein
MTERKKREHSDEKENHSSDKRIKLNGVEWIDEGTRVRIDFEGVTALSEKYRTGDATDQDTKLILELIKLNLAGKHYIFIVLVMEYLHVLSYSIEYGLFVDIDEMDDYNADENNNMIGDPKQCPLAASLVTIERDKEQTDDGKFVVLFYEDCRPVFSAHHILDVRFAIPTITRRFEAIGFGPIIRWSDSKDKFCVAHRDRFVPGYEHNNPIVTESTSVIRLYCEFVSLAEMNRFKQTFSSKSVSCPNS